MDTTKTLLAAVMIAFVAGCGDPSAQDQPTAPSSDALSGTWNQAAADLCQSISFDGGGNFTLQWVGTDIAGTACQTSGGGHNEGTYSLSGSSLTLSIFDPNAGAKPRMVLWTVSRSYAISGDTLTLTDPTLSKPTGQDGAYAAGAFARAP